MAKRPLFAIGLFAFIAALLCTKLSLNGMVVLVITAVICLAVALPFCRRTAMKAMAFCAVGALAASGLFLVKEVAVVAPQMAHDGEEVAVTMQVREMLPSGQGVMVRVVDGELDKGTNLCLWFTRRDLYLQPGDIVKADVMLTAAFDQYAFDDVAFAKSNNVYLFAAFTDQTWVTWEPPGDELTWWDQALFSSRTYIHNTLYRYMPYDEAALCEGVLLGYRQNIDAETSWAYRVSGIYHLLAVSGQHLSMLVGVLFWLFDHLLIRRRRVALLGMALSFSFTALCGFSPSVTRACVMTMLMLAGCLFRRRVDGMNSVGWAALVMIVFDPFVIYDIGFQLSIASTLGIVMLFPIWQREIVERTERVLVFGKRPITAVLSAVGLSISATLMTQPFTAIYFGEMSVYFLIGNLICVPLSSVLLVLCLIFVAASLVTIPLTVLLAQAMTWICRMMTMIAQWTAALPHASICVNHPFVTLWILLLTVTVIVAYGWFGMRGVRKSAVCMIAMLLCVWPLAHVSQKDITTVIPVSDDAPTLVIETNDSRGIIFQGDGDTLARVMVTLRSEGIDELSWVLWLNEASWRSVDVSPLTVNAETLITVDETTAYANLPSAERTETIADGDRLYFSSNGVIERCGEHYLVTVGETTMLLCGDECDITKLPAAWRQVNMVAVNGTAPEHAQQLSAQYAVVFCKYGKKDTVAETVPQAWGTPYVTGKDRMPIFITRGNGDMTLRTY